MKQVLNKTTQPWWKQGWLWFLISGPLIVVIAGFVTMYLAYHGTDEVIHDGYTVNGKVVSLDDKNRPVEINEQSSKK